MSRDISSALLTALTGSEIEPFFACEFMFDTQTVTDINGNPFDVSPMRLWTGVGNRVIEVQGADQTFVGTGQLLNIGGLDEVNDLSAKSLSACATLIFRVLIASVLEMSSCAVKPPMSFKNLV